MPWTLAAEKRKPGAKLDSSILLLPPHHLVHFSGQRWTLSTPWLEHANLTLLRLALVCCGLHPSRFYTVIHSPAVVSSSSLGRRLQVTGEQFSYSRILLRLEKLHSGQIYLCLILQSLFCSLLSCGRPYANSVSISLVCGFILVFVPNGGVLL